MFKDDQKHGLKSKVDRVEHSFKKHSIIIVCVCVCVSIFEEIKNKNYKLIF